MSRRKGIILAGGLGTRLFPLTIGTSKQLLPVYDKPMIYYALSVLMLTGIREIAIITTPLEKNNFKRLLADGNNLGLNIIFIEQSSPDGIAQAYILAKNFLNGSASTLILGDNIFFGYNLSTILKDANKSKKSTVFTYSVKNPSRYGVVNFNKKNKVEKFIEKPKNPLSNYALTGLYFLDGSAPERAHKLKPSKRGELEIVSLLNSYLKDDIINVKKLGRGFAWLDVGTHESLLNAGNFIKTIQDRQGQYVGCIEEISYENNYIDRKKLLNIAKTYDNNDYGKYLKKLNKIKK